MPINNARCILAVSCSTAWNNHDPQCCRMMSDKQVPWFVKDSSSDFQGRVWTMKHFANHQGLGHFITWCIMWILLVWTCIGFCSSMSRCQADDLNANMSTFEDANIPGRRACMMWPHVTCFLVHIDTPSQGKRWNVFLITRRSVVLLPWLKLF